MKINPLDDRVVVRPNEAEETTAGGIVLPDAAKEKQQRGTVIAVGPGRMLDSGERSPVSVKVGDQVKFACVDGPDFDGHQVDFDDLMSRLVRYKRAEHDAMERWQESCRIRADKVVDLRTAVLGAEPDVPIDIQPSTDG